MLLLSFIFEKQFCFLALRRSRIPSCHCSGSKKVSMSSVRNWSTSSVKPSFHHPHTKTTFSACSWAWDWPRSSSDLLLWFSFASIAIADIIVINWATNNFVKMENKISSTSLETAVWHKFITSSIKVVQLAVQEFRQIWEIRADVSTPMARPPSAAPTSPCYPHRLI